LDIVDSPHLLSIILLALIFIVQLSVTYPLSCPDYREIIKTVDRVCKVVT
jgi:hypothetical protein